MREEEAEAPHDRPDVAIVMPVFNSGSALKEALASARAQTRPCEIVVVDDGSTDPETLGILAALDEPHVVVVRQANGGAASARNAGIRATSARFVLPLDADDLVEPGYVQKAAAVLEDRPEVGIVYCLADMFGDVEAPWDLPEFSRDAMVVDNIVFISAMFRRTDWERVGGFDESLRSGGEDWDFWLSLIELDREVVRLPEVLFHYRIHGEPRSFRHEELADLFTTVFRKHERLFVDHIGAIYDHRFETLREVNRLRAIERRALRLRRLVPPLSSWLRGDASGTRGD